MIKSRCDTLSRILLLCFVISVVCISCISREQDTAGEGNSIWLEPQWNQTKTWEEDIQWKFASGHKIQYRETQKATVYSRGHTEEREHSLIVGYAIKDNAEKGIAHVVMIGENLKTQGMGTEMLQFLLRSSPQLGRFSMLPSGKMTDVKGLIGTRSLPTFPEKPVRVGARWNGEMGIAIVPNLPGAIATGICHYELQGFADVRGHRWAKISFQGNIALSNETFAMRKIIGVMTDDRKGSTVHEVITGSPADKAGLLSGDIIKSFGGMSVSSWSDLFYAVALSPSDQAVQAVILRNNVRKKVFMAPQTTVSGKISATGTITGSVIFDITEGILLRMQVNPLSLKYAVHVDDVTAEHEVQIVGLTQLIESAG
ncbi:MAG: PDZ domain-containing protein [Deltaproteobacteria bacterium]|nr:PDZ domain-containing protein [Deltaproteobacteria bacterium]